MTALKPLSDRHRRVEMSGRHKDRAVDALQPIEVIVAGRRVAARQHWSEAVDDWRRKQKKNAIGLAHRAKRCMADDEWCRGMAAIELLR